MFMFIYLNVSVEEREKAVSSSSSLPNQLQQLWLSLDKVRSLELQPGFPYGTRNSYPRASATAFQGPHCREVESIPAARHQTNCCGTVSREG